jgi:hypothetical protein
MDFITHLPNSYSYNAILIIIDRLIKMKHFIYCKKNYNFENIAHLYVKYIWKLHNLLRIIIFNRGFQFVSEFWKHLIKHLGITALFRLRTIPKPISKPKLPIFSWNNICEAMYFICKITKCVSYH